MGHNVHIENDENNTGPSTLKMRQLASPTTSDGTGETGKQFGSRPWRKRGIQRSWLRKKEPRERWMTIIPLIGAVLGLCLAGLLIWDGIRRTPYLEYCTVYRDHFSSPTLNDAWTFDISSTGFGNGEFETTTNSTKNVYIKDGMLNIQATVQDPPTVLGPPDTNITNLCPDQTSGNCVSYINTSIGVIANPIQSARIKTKVSIRYGKVEVVARLPRGDWLWPAIWMLPTNNTYGGWPRSGEIDIIESRGNNYTYPAGGDNTISSTLHWGPSWQYDRWDKTHGSMLAPGVSFSDSFHTFGVEWTPKYIYTYLDRRLFQVMRHNFAEPMWKFGKFWQYDSPSVQLGNPWESSSSDSSPFDQDFHLILDVAVGGTNGWFWNGVAGKPWDDQATDPLAQFWQSRSKWYPTWQKGHGPVMQVKSVTMWQLKGYNGC
ncbi:uncharacterized protein A1O5_12576 [Cladophialophora psammophila CBS 110553]|uniref:GH16 domain-containing protein n=1 Tax=Cladophialophora psammophila CBS 110553 TaxID=1182543 RepID=W9WCR0_9EURO|nr:uncharacterized protein A1O5_12576 [Cladophialophora psammophila CBS 110553]EXJ56309.1 hypothetical protein A1O5_12576 [Cladophialophora psammophila CBS 110553]